MAHVFWGASESVKHHGDQVLSLLFKSVALPCLLSVDVCVCVCVCVCKFVGIK
jgi:hypothetical protein